MRFYAFFQFVCVSVVCSFFSALIRCCSPAHSLFVNLYAHKREVWPKLLTFYDILYYFVVAFEFCVSFCYSRKSSFSDLVLFIWFIVVTAATIFSVSAAFFFQKKKFIISFLSVRFDFNFQNRKCELLYASCIFKTLDNAPYENCTRIVYVTTDVFISIVLA